MNRTTTIHIKLPMALLDRIKKFSIMRNKNPQNMIIWLLEMGLFQEDQVPAEAAKQSPDSKSDDV